jgi:hypothetical protein
MCLFDDINQFWNETIDMGSISSVSQYEKLIKSGIGILPHGVYCISAPASSRQQNATSEARHALTGAHRAAGTKKQGRMPWRQWHG